MQGFYVLVDYHAAPGDTTVSSGNFIGDWQTLWRAITALPNFSSELAGRMFLDLCNEPDGIGLRCAAPTLWMSVFFRILNLSVILETNVRVCEHKVYLNPRLLKGKMLSEAFEF